MSLVAESRRNSEARSNTGTDQSNESEENPTLGDMMDIRPR